MTTGLVELHDGACQPFIIGRRRDDSDVWEIPNGQTAVQEDPLLGWRVEPFAYTDTDGIFGAGGFRPSSWWDGSPFGTGILSLPPAVCRGAAMLRGPDAHLLEGSVLLEPHDAPHPECSCGYRMVRDVKDAAGFYFRHKQELWERGTVNPGMKKSVAMFAVRGLGRVCRSVEFLHFNDPLGTARVQYVALEAVVILDKADAHTKAMWERRGCKAYVVDDLNRVHEASRCGNEHEVIRVDLDPEAHALRISTEPGRDGGHHWTSSGGFGFYGAAGVLLKTREPQPRYLLQRRAFNVDYGGTWSIPGGARHQNETAGEAAARELGEEMGIHSFEALTVTQAATLEEQGWTYTTITAECDGPLPVKIQDGEVIEAAWLTGAQLQDLAVGGKLHPLFEAALPTILKGGVEQ